MRKARRNESSLNNHGAQTFFEETDIRIRTAPETRKAEISVDSDDENPNPEALAQFLESKTDFSIPLAKQREQLWQEKTRSLRRVNTILGLNGDLLNPDFQGSNDETESLKEDIDSYLTKHEDSSIHQSEQLFGIGQWFHLKTDEAKKDEMTIDFEDALFDASFKDVGHLVSTMGALRGKMSSSLEKLLARMCEIVKNDESKRQLRDQQERFATEINTIMEALQRVEGHAKGLTTSNLELREHLKAVEAEKLSWQRRYMSLQAKEESIVRQMETAIKQRTEALQIHLRKGDTGALQQLMDQVRQHQLDLFASQEQLRLKDEELSKSLTEKQMLEERISGFAFEMKDLRQAAGPTANLINKLKSDARDAQMNERKMREELRLLQLEMKAKPKVLSEIVLVNKQVQEINPVRPPSPVPVVETSKDISTNIQAAVSTQSADAINLQREMAKLQAIIDSLREKIKEKDRLIEVQQLDIVSRDELIKVYVSSTSSQFDKIQAKGQQLANVLQDQSTLAAKFRSEMDSMNAKLKNLKEIEVFASDEGDSTEPNGQKAQEQGNAAEELSSQLGRLTDQNKRVIIGLQQALELYEAERLKCDELERRLQKQVSIPEVSERKEVVAPPPPVEKHTSVAISELCRHFCNRALQYYGDIVRDVFGMSRMPISNTDASSWLNQAKDLFSGKRIFDKILDSMMEFLKEKWSGIADLVASIRENSAQAANLATERANLNFEQLVKTSQFAEIKKVLASHGPPKVMKTMQERYEEQKQKWEAKKEKIKQERAACIMKCLDSFMHVVQVNFKGALGAETAQRTSALIYSSLLDDGEPVSLDPISALATVSAGGQPDLFQNSASRSTQSNKVFSVPVRYLGDIDASGPRMQVNVNQWGWRQDPRLFSSHSSGAVTARELGRGVKSHSMVSTPQTAPRSHGSRTEKVFLQASGVGLGLANFGKQFGEARQAMTANHPARYAVLAPERLSLPQSRHSDQPHSTGGRSRDDLLVAGLLPNL